ALCEELERLRELVLADNPLGPEGVAYLARSVHLAGLEHLDVRGTRAGHVGARALRRATFEAHVLA
ncbi:MAG: hypothetical protein AAGI01_09335, partial [Myxococcota bacterium]